jgi:hypothetical protein
MAALEAKVSCGWPFAYAVKATRRSVPLAAALLSLTAA